MTYDATSRRTLLATAALALTLTTTACGGDEVVELAAAAEPVTVSQPVEPEPVKAVEPVEPVKAVEPVEPAAPAPAPGSALPDGTYEVHVVRAEDGALVLDRGRFVVGEPTEPGVDSTAPITFDTGQAAERRETPVADDASLRMQVAGEGMTAVTYAQLAAAVAEDDRPFLATVAVSAGEVVDLERLYRA